MADKAEAEANELECSTKLKDYEQRGDHDGDKTMEVDFTEVSKHIEEDEQDADKLFEEAKRTMEQCNQRKEDCKRRKQETEQKKSRQAAQEAAAEEANKVVAAESDAMQQG